MLHPILPRLSACAIAAALLLLAVPAKPAAPAGNPLSIEWELRDRLETALNDVPPFATSRFERDLKAFVYEHRMLIDVARVEDQRLVDAAICILAKHFGYPDFDEFIDSEFFRDWCDELSRSA